MLIACDQLAECLCQAYSNPGGSGNFSTALEVLTLLVRIQLDLVRYNEALAQGESGINNEREDSLLCRFPPGNGGTLYIDRPAVVVGLGGIILLWYLPGALTRKTQVGIAIHNNGILRVTRYLRRRCGMPQRRWNSFSSAASQQRGIAERIGGARISILPLDPGNYRRDA
jgi:hypothetical protein